MREKFLHHQLNVEELELFRRVNKMLTHHLMCNTPLTTKQLYHKCHKCNILGLPPITPDMFRGLIRRGLMAGEIDWNITPDYINPGVINSAQPETEVWFHTPGLNAWWSEAVARRNDFCDINLVFGGSKKWALHTLYNAADRFTNHNPVYLMLLSDPTLDSDSVYNRTVGILKKMLVVRLARRMFNEDCKQELWRPEGFNPTLTGMGSGQRNKVIKTLKAASLFVDTNVRTRHIRLSGVLPARERGPEELDRVLSVALANRGTRSTMKAPYSVLGDTSV